MNRKEAERLKQRVEYWKGVLLLQDWIIDVLIQDKPCEENENVDGEMETNIEYLHGYIYLYPLFFKHDKQGQDTTIIHELIHCLVAEMKQKMIWAKNGKAVFDDDITRINEQLVSKLERIVVQLVRR